jgi:Zn-dependent peptidase ImmA (M78 family)
LAEALIVASPRDREISRLASQQIEALRRFLAESQDRSVTDFDLLPVDLSAIATLRGVKVDDEVCDTPSSSNAALSESGAIGSLDRRSLLITISGSRQHTRRRFTLAHELGHLLLHNDLRNYREVVQLENSSAHSRQPLKEQEANSFAVELMMPSSIIRRVFEDFFGNPIDGTKLDEDLAYFLSQGRKKVSAQDIVDMGPVERARRFARIASFKSRQFKPMSDLFDVSVETMGYRLLELGLVS